MRREFVEMRRRNLPSIAVVALHVPVTEIVAARMTRKLGFAVVLGTSAAVSPVIEASRKTMNNVRACFMVHFSLLFRAKLAGVSFAAAQTTSGIAPVGFGV